MNTQEREIIDHLFDKLREAVRQASPREPVAETHIRSRIQAQPGAPYLMAQTIVMQEQALEAAQARITGLEDELARRPAGGGGFLSGLFGGGGQTRPSPMLQRDPNTMRGTVPTQPGFGPAYGAPGMVAQPGRGGFLAGAAQTAMGVAGGVLLGSMIGSALGGGGEANAAEAPASQPEPEPATDAAADFGGDFGDDS